MDELLTPMLADDAMPDGTHRYDHCNACNYDTHICGGCGQDLSHDGLEHLKDGRWAKHEGCTD